MKKYFFIVAVMLLSISAYAQRPGDPNTQEIHVTKCNGCGATSESTGATPTSCFNCGREFVVNQRVSQSGVVHMGGDSGKAEFYYFYESGSFGNPGEFGGSSGAWGISYVDALCRSGFRSTDGGGANLSGRPTGNVTKIPINSDPDIGSLDHDK